MACIFDDAGVVYGYNDDNTAPLQLHRVLQDGHAPLSRFVGSCRIQLHSLQRTELNGRQGVILPLPPPPHERVPVQLDGSVPAIRVKPQNILILDPADGTSPCPASALLAQSKCSPLTHMHANTDHRIGEPERAGVGVGVEVGRLTMQIISGCAASLGRTPLR